MGGDASVVVQEMWLGRTEWTEEVQGFLEEVAPLHGCADPRGAHPCSGGERRCVLCLADNADRSDPLSVAYVNWPHYCRARFRSFGGSLEKPCRRSAHGIVDARFRPPCLPLHRDAGRAFICLSTVPALCLVSVIKRVHREQNESMAGRSLKFLLMNAK